MQVIFSNELQADTHEKIRADLLKFIKDAGFDISNPAIDIVVSLEKEVKLDVQSCNDELKLELRNILAGRKIWP